MPSLGLILKRREAAHTVIRMYGLRPLKQEWMCRFNGAVAFNQMDGDFK
jgi:hypothetical protein